MTSQCEKTTKEPPVTVKGSWIFTSLIPMCHGGQQKMCMHVFHGDEKRVARIQYIYRSSHLLLMCNKLNKKINLH